jgi:WG containing repeat
MRKIILLLLFLSVFSTISAVSADLSQKSELTPATYEGKAGYINKEGKTIIPFEFDEAHYFSEGLAAVKRNNQWGFIDTNGQFVIKPDFNYVSDFSDGVASVHIGSDLDYEVAIINQSGNILQFFPDIMEYRLFFKNGLASACKPKEEKCGFVDKQGNWIIPAIYDQQMDHYDFSEGVTPVCLDGKCGFIDEKNRWVITPQYWEATGFSEGKACVCKVEEECFFINSKNQKLFDAGNICFPFQENRAIYIKPDSKGNLIGYLDPDGRIIGRGPYEGTEDFSEGLAAVSIKGKTGFINEEGQFVINPIFNTGSFGLFFLNGLARICEKNEDSDENLCFLIDTNGKKIWDDT